MELTLLITTKFRSCSWGFSLSPKHPSWPITHSGNICRRNVRARDHLAGRPNSPAAGWGVEKGFEHSSVGDGSGIYFGQMSPSPYNFGEGGALWCVCVRLCVCARVSSFTKTS